ncbi:PD-(D/E)XK nuclease family protein, partial [bacterium]
MSRIEIVPGHENLVERACSFLESEGSDFSESIVVFPGKRPAHFLRRAIALRTGRSAIPPRVLAMDGFVEFIYRSLLKREDTELHPLDAIAILYDLHVRMQKKLGGESFRTLDAFLSLGSKLFGAAEELCITLVAPRDAAGALTASPMKNGEAIADFYAAFYPLLREQRFTTRALCYADVAENIRAASFDEVRRVVLAGFYALSRAEQRIFRHLAGLDQSVLLFQDGPGLNKHLQGIGIPYEPSPPGSRRQQISLFTAADTHGEVLTLNTRVKELQDAGQTLKENAVIVVPSADALFPLVHWTLAMLPRDSYNISLSYPGTRTPVFGFLHSLLELLASMEEGKVYAPDYIKFVLHPYTKSIRCGARTDVTRILFHQIEQKLAGERSLTFFFLEELENSAEVFSRVAEATRATEEALSPDRLREHLIRIHDRTIRNLLSLKSIGDAARKIMDVLLFVSEETTADRHDLFRPFILPVLEECSAITTSRIASRTLSGLPQYSSFFRNALQSVAVPFPGTPLHGLQVLGFLETRNLQFKRVFLLDANDDVLPGTAGVDVLLPQGIRAALGLPLQRDREDIAAYYFDLLLQGAEEVDIFFRSSGKKEKSRFIEKLLWRQQLESGDLKRTSPIRRADFSLKISNHRPEMLRKTDEVLHFLQDCTYSATALDSYLTCQLKFAFAHVMRLQEQEGVDEEIDRPSIGRFVHSVLARFDRQNVGCILDPVADRGEELEEVIDAEFERAYGKDPGGARFLLREQIRGQLKRFLASYRARVLASGPVRLLGVEAKMTVMKNGYTFKGIADRIEQRGDRIFILDFKTGHDASRLMVNTSSLVPGDPATWPEAIGSCQLPLYMLLYSEQEKVAVEKIFPAYIMLGKKTMDEDAECGLFDGGTASAASWAMIEQAIFEIVREINDPARPFEPAVDLKQTCPKCPYAGLCG